MTTDPLQSTLEKGQDSGIKTKPRAFRGKCERDGGGEYHMESQNWGTH